MDDTTNQIDTPKQWFKRFALAFCLVSVSCGGNPREEVYGRYRIDLAHQLANLRYEELKPAVQRTFKRLTTTLAQHATYRFSAEGCAREIGGVEKSFTCEFLRVEKRRTVVYRSVDDAGRTRYLRLTPTERGVRLDNGIFDRELERIP